MPPGFKRCMTLHGQAMIDMADCADDPAGGYHGTLGLAKTSPFLGQPIGNHPENHPLARATDIHTIASRTERAACWRGTGFRRRPACDSDQPAQDARIVDRLRAARHFYCPL